jgi:hypothetical protein
MFRRLFVATMCRIKRRCRQSLHWFELRQHHLGRIERPCGKWQRDLELLSRHGYEVDLAKSQRK